MDQATKVHAAMAEGGSSDRDLNRLIDDLMEACGLRSGGRTLYYLEVSKSAQELADLEHFL